MALTEAPTPLCNQRAKREKVAQGTKRIKNAMGHKNGTNVCALVEVTDTRQTSQMRAKLPWKLLNSFEAQKKEMY